MKILYYISGYDGCGYYRVQLPAKYLNKRKDVSCKISSEYQKEAIDWADLIVLQKQFQKEALPYLYYAKKKNKKVLIECDDDYFHIPISNPAYKYYLNKANDLIKFYEVADGITVSTPHLGNLLSSYNSNIFVLPNSLDFSFLDKLKNLSYEEKFKHTQYLTKHGKKLSLLEVQSILKDKISIGWGGSATHFADLQIITPVLKKLFSENKDLVLVLIGAATKDLIQAIPEGQLLLVQSIPVFLYHQVLSTMSWDIGVCPIEDNLFNRSKSNIKFLEFTSNNMAVACSSVENYEKTILDKDIGLLAKNNFESWYNNLNLLIKNNSLRNKLSTNAGNFIKENYAMTKNVDLWYDAYLKILG